MLFRSSTGDGTKPDEDRIRLREADADFFRKWVQAPGAMLATYTATDEQEPDGARSESQTNIINNRNFIINRVRALGSGGRRRLVSILEEQTDIVVIETPKLSDALAAYASTYQRGLRQAEIDRIRAELFGEADDEIGRAHV